MGGGPPCLKKMGGAWVGGPGSSPNSRASAVWAITCVAACVLSMGGVAPDTTPVRAHPASPGTICAASRCAGVGPLVLRGPHVGRRLGRGGGSHSGSPPGRGGPTPLPRGVGAGAPAAGGLVGGRGGGVSRRGLPVLVPGGGLRYSFPALSVSPARSLRARACGRG